MPRLLREGTAKLSLGHPPQVRLRPFAIHVPIVPPAVPPPPSGPRESGMTGPVMTGVGVTLAPFHRRGEGVRVTLLPVGGHLWRTLPVAASRRRAWLRPVPAR
jgi:hypothetical protein